MMALLDLATEFVQKLFVWGLICLVDLKILEELLNYFFENTLNTHQGSFTIYVDRG